VEEEDSDLDSDPDEVKRADVALGVSDRRDESEADIVLTESETLAVSLADDEGESVNDGDMLCI
jgi:hypothetical protein